MSHNILSTSFGNEDSLEQRVDTRLIASKLEVEHHTVLSTLDRYKTEISKFGVVRFEVDKPTGHQGGRPEKFALLNEQQCQFIGSLSRNTEKVVDFKFWLVEQFHKARQVLPAVTLTEDEMILQSVLLLQSRIAKQSAEIALLEASNAVMAPKADYTDKVLLSVSEWTITTIASELGLTAHKLNQTLKANGVQFKDSDGVWVLYAKYKDLGFTKSRTSPYTDTFGRVRTNITSVWTEVGRNFIHGLVNPDLNSKMAIC